MQIGEEAIRNQAISTPVATDPTGAQELISCIATALVSREAYVVTQRMWPTQGYQDAREVQVWVTRRLNYSQCLIVTVTSTDHCNVVRSQTAGRATLEEVIALLCTLNRLRKDYGFLLSVNRTDTERTGA